MVLSEKSFGNTSGKPSKREKKDFSITVIQISVTKRIDKINKMIIFELKKKWTIVDCVGAEKFSGCPRIKLEIKIRYFFWLDCEENETKSISKIIKK